MKENTPAPAYIYCRVSSAKQVTEGHGLASQELRCRDFAERKGYRVAGVFRDEGISGGLIDRPGMQAMLETLETHDGQTQPVVIIDDISRLARGLDAHIQLRTAIAGAGGRLESPSIEFGDDPDSLLVENLLASVSQHQRQKNAEQVVNRMKARVMAGYWCFASVAGYRYETVAGHGRMLVPDEPNATAIREVLEGYASGRFETHAEIKRFLETFPSFPRNSQGEVNLFFVHRLLKRSLYAGYIDVPKWGVSLHRGKHTPLVSFETWQKAQDRLNGRMAQAPIRADTTPDFPLRGFVTCASCDRPMTAAWSKGRNARYGYYFCQNRQCDQSRKSIAKTKIEAAFAELLRRLSPSPELLTLFRRMLKEQWQARLDSANDRRSALKREVRTLETKIDGLMERLLAADSPTLIAAYEGQIKRLETRKIGLREQARKPATPLRSFEDTYRTACDFLASPWKIWENGSLEQRRMVLRLAFADRIPYYRNGGYRTAIPALPFKALAGYRGGTDKMVEPRGVEPLTSTMPL